MKLYVMALLVLSSFLTYKAQGIRPGKVALSDSNHQDIVKIIFSLVKGSDQDDQLLAKTAKSSSGINRKLMTKTASSSSTTASDSEKNKHDSKPQVKSTHQLVGKEKVFNSSPGNSKHWKKDVITEQYPDVTDIGEMDYTPARKKSPIHN